MHSTAENAGRVLMVGLPGPALDDATRERLAELRPGGIILFARNLTAPRDLPGLLDEASAVLPPPRLFAIDQEGGRVSRLETWIGPTPPAASLATSGAGGRTFRLARATARALRALGLNLDFAPVVDLCGPDAPNGIGDRSFGTDPDLVARFAGSFVEGLQGAGVAACLKHFPGLGDTRVDSHDALPTVSRDLEHLERADLIPYRRVADRVACVMVGHAHYPALDSTPAVPASLSRAVVSVLLRDRLGFRGLVVSDDMEMGAVAPIDSDGRAAVAAVAAGCDLVLYCADLERAARARRALVEAAEEDEAFARRLDDAARRVQATAARWPPARPDPASWTRASAEIARTVDPAATA